MNEELNEYKALAAAVVNSAFRELIHSDRAIRDAARRFFFDESIDGRRIRGIWFAWLGLSESAAKQKADEIIADYKKREMTLCSFTI